MNRFTRSILIASALGLPLAGCSSMPDFNADPTEWFNVDFLNNKKPLPGTRKPVFPEGVPGVTKGVPADLVKGNQPPPDAGLAQGQTLQNSPGAPAVEQAAVEAEPAPPPKPKAKPKPKPKVAAKPAPLEPEATERAPAPVTVRRSNSPPPPPQQQQPAAAQWPEPPGTQGAASGGVQWPDPPSR